MTLLLVLLVRTRRLDNMLLSLVSRRYLLLVSRSGESERVNGPFSLEFIADSVDLRFSYAQ